MAILEQRDKITNLFSKIFSKIVHQYRYQSFSHGESPSRISHKILQKNLRKMAPKNLQRNRKLDGLGAKVSGYVLPTVPTKKPPNCIPVLGFYTLKLEIPIGVVIETSNAYNPFGTGEKGLVHLGCFLCAEETFGGVNGADNMRLVLPRTFRKPLTAPYFPQTTIYSSHHFRPRRFQVALISSEPRWLGTVDHEDLPLERSPEKAFGSSYAQTLI